MTKIDISKFTPTKGKIFVTNIEEGMQKTSGGIILTDDNFKDHGIRPRWAKVIKIADDVTEVSVNEWVLVEHGRWTLRMPMTSEGEDIFVWMIDPMSILLVSDDYQGNDRYYL